MCYDVSFIFSMLGCKKHPRWLFSGWKDLKKDRFFFLNVSNVSKYMLAYENVPPTLSYRWHHHYGNVSLTVLSGSPVEFTENGHVHDGSRGPTAARQLIRFLGRSPVNLPVCNGIVMTIVNHVQKRTRDVVRRTQRWRRRRWRNIRTDTSDLAEQPGRPKCGACPMRLHGARATWQRTLLSRICPGQLE